MRINPLDVVPARGAIYIPPVTEIDDTASTFITFVAVALFCLPAVVAWLVS